jgi:hypothetical protein
MPPMLPICISTMTRSGASSVTEAMTSGPVLTDSTVTSGPLMTASTYLRRVGASLATRMVCTAGTLSDVQVGSVLGPSGEEVIGRLLQGTQLVHVVPEERDAPDWRRRHLLGQVGVGLLFTPGHSAHGIQVGLKGG